MKVRELRKYFIKLNSKLVGGPLQKSCSIPSTLTLLTSLNKVLAKAKGSIFFVPLLRSPLPLFLSFLFFLRPLPPRPYYHVSLANRVWKWKTWLTEAAEKMKRGAAGIFFSSGDFVKWKIKAISKAHLNPGCLINLSRKTLAVIIGGSHSGWRRFWPTGCPSKLY